MQTTNLIIFLSIFPEKTEFSWRQSEHAAEVELERLLRSDYLFIKQIQLDVPFDMPISVNELELWLEDNEGLLLAGYLGTPIKEFGENPITNDLKIIEEQIDLELTDLRRKFFQNTIAFYLTDPNARRALADDGRQCMYLTPTGCKCAIGRGIAPDNYNPSFESWSTNAVIKFSGSELFKKLGVEFLNSIQRFHDRRCNWDIYANKITQDGLDHIERIKDEYKL